MFEFYCVWTIINILICLFGIWISGKADEKLDEAKEILDKDEKICEEMKKTIAEWEEEIKGAGNNG